MSRPRPTLPNATSAEKLQRLILEELHHRVKNTLAIVQAIANQSVRTAVDLPHAGEALAARFSALGRVHDLLLRTAWGGRDAARIVENGH